MEGKEIIDKIIIGRVEPYIYAFTTNTVPNYLKIGDTYRPVPIRLKEWKKYFPDLEEKYKEKALVGPDVFFRDYAVHKYVEEKLGKARLKENILPKDIYYSNEFFENATDGDIKEAIEDIKESYKNNDNRYQFYDANTCLPEIIHFKRENKEWKPRPNQQDTIDNFMKARDNGRKNLLMYAVMRFGKSFTSMMCAKEMKAKLVVVVSAKADVKLEWRKTVEQPKNFEEYYFISAEELERNNNEISDRLSKGEKITVFLTLQDLQGDMIKEKHKDIFKNKIDLLIVDETHFGARAESYGKVLENTKYEKDVKDKHEKEENTIIDLNKNLKFLDVDMTLHLSGTPYRILMGSEFEKEDIISFCQFSDIIKEQENWDNEYFEDIENSKINPDTRKPYQIWDNPYFGFPQMVRFAFNPSKKAKEKLKEYKNNGYTYAFSALLKPKSIRKAEDGANKKFINEKEILELFQVIDGSVEDENVLGFLNYDKIKEGKMCRHIVCVLPYCASCDALEKLLLSNKDKFINLNEYEIINISGVENSNQYKTISAIKNKIKKCERNNKKTLTLTVNRMLTGSTVEEWDTMIYLKDTASPQEYDQSIFRLQNQYIKKYIEEKGDIIKYNMKPQTILVDFDPYRMFSLQEQKSKMYNVNIEESGNSLLEERLNNELKISPIITINKNKIVEIEPRNIMEAVSEYSREKGVIDEVFDIPIDFKLLDDKDFRKEIIKQAEIGSNKGLSIDSIDGNEDIEIPEKEDNNINIQNIEDEVNNNENKQKEKDNIEKKVRTYYARILFYSFLTNDKVMSLNNIVNSIENNDNNKRIAKNLGLNIDILKLVNEKMNAYMLSHLDYKIQNINDLSKDNSISEIEKAYVAVNKFKKLSQSEIITPNEICKNMIETIPNKYIEKISQNSGKILDIASKMGEFALAIYERLVYNLNIRKEDIKNIIYSIPTSKVAYEFTRKIYEILGLNLDNIASLFNSYDLLKIVNDDGVIDYKLIKNYLLQNNKFSNIELSKNLFFRGGDKLMKFDVIVGNPPYQENIENRGEQPPLYHLFYDCATTLSDNVTLITPARFLFEAGKTPSLWNKKMLNDEHFKVIEYFQNSKDVFSDVDIKGGVAITCINKNKTFGAIKTFVKDEVLRRIIKKVIGNGCETISDIIYSNTCYKYTEKFFSENNGFSNRVSGGSARYLSSSVFNKFPEVFFEKKPKDGNNYIKIIGRKNNERAIYYFNEKYINPPENFTNYKVLLASSNGTGMLGETLSEPVVAEPFMGSTETFVSFGNFKNKYEAENLEKYFKTKLARIMLGTKKVTQGNKKAEVWSNVPLQDFTDKSDINWNNTIKEIDQQLYKKYKLSNDEIKYIETTVKEME